MRELESMRNLGPVSAAWLRQAGVSTVSELRQLGAVAAFARVKRRQPMASLNLLWALAGALDNKDVRELSAMERLRLHEELRTSARKLAAVASGVE